MHVHYRTFTCTRIHTRVQWGGDIVRQAAHMSVTRTTGGPPTLTRSASAAAARSCARVNNTRHGEVQPHDLGFKVPRMMRECSIEDDYARGGEGSKFTVEVCELGDVITRHPAPAQHLHMLSLTLQSPQNTIAPHDKL